jgi:hypothetical protein
MLGLAESLGGPRTLFGGQAPEVDETFEHFRATAERVLGASTWPMLLCLRIRIGIR